MIQSQYHLRDYCKMESMTPANDEVIHGWCQQSTTHTHYLGKIRFRDSVWIDATTGEPLKCKPTHWKEVRD